MIRFYVICPVASDPSFTFKRGIIERVARALGLEPVFPLNASPPVPISVLMTGTAFALADLSLERPSCYFELGVAYARGLRRFVIAREDTPVHQTGDQGEVEFYRDAEYEVVLRRVLTRYTTRQACS